VASLAPAAQRASAGAVQSWQEVGGLVGRFALALLVLAIVSRRRLLWVFQVPGLIVVPLTFWMAQSGSVATVSWMMFFAGLFTVAQFSFWGNYLPRVYPTHLRGTGEGFAANIGGRMIGTSFAYVTTALVQPMMSGPPPISLAKAATLVAAFVYVAGFLLSFALPEPKSEELPE
jgi:sugar phosphate permease